MSLPTGGADRSEVRVINTGVGLAIIQVGNMKKYVGTMKKQVENMRRKCGK